MALGPGKYDYLASFVRDSVNAKGVIVVVFGGDLGSGFSVQAPPEFTAELPQLLHSLATSIALDLKMSSDDRSAAGDGGWSTHMETP